jgi:uncharacterized 2Fe-2S/4Fe-4S cluster protein (DUF4445 family)
MSIQSQAPGAARPLAVIARDGVSVRTLHATRGESLLDVLRRGGVHITAACGGKKNCRKCTVQVAGEGDVQSCHYAVTRDIEVSVTREARAEILDGMEAKLKPVANNCGIVREGRGVVSVIEGCDGTIDASAAGEGIFGIAVDIGTTTVVVYLEDLLLCRTLDVVAFINPQTRYGHDVVSRIHHTMERPDGLAELQREIRDAINAAMDALATRNGIDARCLYKLTVVGNNTMLHLFLGVDPASIAAAPYTPRFTEQKLLRGEDAGMRIHPRGIVVVLPSVSGYVGADITAGIASTDLCERDDYSLFVDIGTNGEMALGSRERLCCCSTAAGPAFEGATIECGVGGVEGAISRYESGRYDTIGGKPAIGICGSGILDIAADLRSRDLADASGYMEKDALIVPRAASAVAHDIVFTPADVRQVQLATAAIYAGIRIMLKEAGVTMEQVGRLYLAGGFGNYLRIESAVAVGLLPASLQARIVPVGNSAGSGSRLALRSVDFTAQVNRVAQAAQYIELSMRMDFNEEYVLSMNLERRG